MKVLFLKHVVNVWKAWEIKEVKAGYASNMLIPQGLEKHRQMLIEDRHKIVEQITWKSLEFTLKTWTNNKVYWWIWEKDIISAIKKKFKVELSKKHIDMPDWHLKKLWESQIYIKLGKDAIAKILVIIKES